MELQLGLALPGGGGGNWKQHLGFDLNNCFDDHDVLIDAASCISDSTTHYQLMISTTHVENCSKRSFNEAFDDHHDELDQNSPPPDPDHHHVPQTLPLLVWNNNNINNLSDHQDDNINDHDHDLDTTTTTTKSNNEYYLGEVDHQSGGVIGWPPVKSSRKKLCHRHKHGGGGEYLKPILFVKVKMEGVGIARKVDLTLHASYHSLTNTLMPMFGKCKEDVKLYNLTYQDKEGDWLLAGDVPWGSFIETVQRLKLLKNGGC